MCDKSYRPDTGGNLFLLGMLVFEPKYRKYLVLALMMLVAIPCSVKKETKQWLRIVEAGQQPTTAKTKIACANFDQLRQANRKKQVQNHLRPFVTPSVDAPKWAIEKRISLPAFFNTQKEKVPSHLLFEQFLI